MAFTHIQIGNASTHGPQLRAMLSNLEAGQQQLFDIVATIITMMEGDGSSSAHFSEVMVRYGVVDLATAKAMYEELQSLKGKLDNDGSVTFVNAAMNQAFNKFR